MQQNIIYNCEKMETTWMSIWTKIAKEIIEQAYNDFINQFWGMFKDTWNLIILLNE